MCNVPETEILKLLSLIFRYTTEHNSEKRFVSNNILDRTLYLEFTWTDLKNLSCLFKIVGNYGNHFNMLLNFSNYTYKMPSNYVFKAFL